MKCEACTRELRAARREGSQPERPQPSLVPKARSRRGRSRRPRSHREAFKRAWVDLIGELVFRIPVIRLAEAQSAHGTPVYMYRFDFQSNDLRCTFARWLKQAGVDSMVVAKLLGHTTSRMVEMLYGHLNDATTSAAIIKLPTSTAPSLAEPATRAVTVSVRRRRGVAGETPTLKLAASDAAPSPPTEPLPALAESRRTRPAAVRGR